MSTQRYWGTARLEAPRGSGYSSTANVFSDEDARAVRLREQYTFDNSARSFSATPEERKPVSSEGVTAIVPMRHSSERVPSKNFRSLNGKPLFRWIVDSLERSSFVSEIVIDTDSPIIAEYTQKNLRDVRLLIRPESLRDGSIPMNAVIANSISQLSGSNFLQTHATSPFLSSATIDAACRRFLTSSADSLFSVSELRGRFWWGASRPINHDPLVLNRTQDLDPIYEENSAIYLFKRSAFDAEGVRVTKNRILFSTPRAESFDIDTEEDWAMAVALAPSLLKG